MLFAVIQAKHGAASVVFRLFGDVTPERLVVEQAIAAHRAMQLGHVPAQKRGWVGADVPRTMRSLVGRHGDQEDGVDWID